MHITAPGLIVVMVVGYIGVNAIVEGIRSLMGRSSNSDDKRENH